MNRRVPLLLWFQVSRTVLIVAVHVASNVMSSPSNNQILNLSSPVKNLPNYSSSVSPAALAACVFALPGRACLHTLLCSLPHRQLASLTVAQIRSVLICCAACVCWQEHNPESPPIEVNVGLVRAHSAGASPAEVKKSRPAAAIVDPPAPSVPGNVRRVRHRSETSVGCTLWYPPSHPVCLFVSASVRVPVCVRMGESLSSHLIYTPLFA